MSNSSKVSRNWGSPPAALTPEQCIEWLEGHRAWMHEVWRENPELRARWESLKEQERRTSGRRRNQITP